MNPRFSADAVPRAGKLERTIPRAAKRGKKPAAWSQLLHRLDQRERQERADLASEWEPQPRPNPFRRGS